MKVSAGLLLYRISGEGPEVFLVHPGGPFWKNKDEGAWSIPKGEYNNAEETPLNCAKREFNEETGHKIEGNFIELCPIKQKGGKIVQAWAIEGDIDPNTIKSNTTTIQWPPKSNKQIEIDEIDKGAWFAIPEAKHKINSQQISFIDQLLQILIKE